MIEPKFLLGMTVITSGVDAEMKRNSNFSEFVKASLEKYANCDWGETCAEDAELNDFAIRGVTEGRLFAVYEYPGNDQMLNIWIITEWDHSCTTILFPREY